MPTAAALSLAPGLPGNRVVMRAEHEHARALAELDREGVAPALGACEAMARERDAAVLEIAGQGRLPRRVVAAAEEPGERGGGVVAHQHRLERRGRRDGAAGAAVEPPPQRPQQQPGRRVGDRSQLKTTTPRATWPVRSAVKPSLISSIL